MTQGMDCGAVGNLKTVRNKRAQSKYNQIAGAPSALKQEMIESGITSRMSGVLGNSGQTHHPSPQDYRLLTTDPSQLSEDIPGDLQSLSWLTSVDVHRLQQMAANRLEFGVGPLSGLLETAQMNGVNVSEEEGSTLQLLSGAQNGLLGMNAISVHNASVTNYSLAGQASVGFQTHPALFQPSLQQVFTLASAGPQSSPSTLYSSGTSFSCQSLCAQPRLAPHNNQDLQPSSFPKPIYSYSCLIAMALKNSKNGSLPVSEIYNFMKEHFPFFKTAPDGWKNSVRHNLSLNKCFQKVENKLGGGSSRKGCLWTLNPARIDKMEEEMQKWKHKDLPAIRRSMANPDELDKLIMDRPESCRRKQSESGLTQRGGRPDPGPTALAQTQLQPQPATALSLHHHHHLLAQAQAQGQTRLASDADLPSPAQTYSVIHAVSEEVDAMDPSFMDFALHGNLWEEMKDESFNLESLGSLSHSPLRLSDCDLPTPGLAPGSSGSGLPFSNLQVTGLYTTCTALEASATPTQYADKQGGGRPIALL